MKSGCLSPPLTATSLTPAFSIFPTSWSPATFLSPTTRRPYRRPWLARLDLTEPVLEYLGRWGRPIGYAYLEQQWPLDMYQTVYAHVPGSAEMPSAGRPFSDAVLERLAARGAGFV